MQHERGQSNDSAKDVNSCHPSAPFMPITNETKTKCDFLAPFSILLIPLTTTFLHLLK